MADSVLKFQGMTAALCPLGTVRVAWLVSGPGFQDSSDKGPRGNSDFAKPVLESWSLSVLVWPTTLSLSFTKKRGIIIYNLVLLLELKEENIWWNTKMMVFNNCIYFLLNCLQATQTMREQCFAYGSLNTYLLSELLVVKMPWKERQTSRESRMSGWCFCCQSYSVHFSEPWKMTRWPQQVSWAGWGICLNAKKCLWTI